MAMAKFNIMELDFMKSLTDCISFMNGHCNLGERCLYRHSLEARKQLGRCFNWPDLCRKIQCRFRHPAFSTQPTATTSISPTSFSSKDNVVSFFWDIENVPIPRGQRPFDIVQRIRQQLVIERGLQEVDFSCYCDINTISKENQQSLHHANVRIIHVPDRKPGAVDRRIMLDLDRFERVHRPPATIVLISGDIDFVCKLSDLRHQARFHVIVIHNKPAKQELKATVNEHYSWELFINEQATSSARMPYFDNSQGVYENHSSRLSPTPRSTKTRSRTSISNSRNNDNLFHKNTLISPASSSYSMQQHRQVDSIPSLMSDINQPTFPVYYFNSDNNIPEYPSSSAIPPSIPMYRSTNYSHFESKNIRSRPMRQASNSTSREMRKQRSSPRDCPDCGAEFDTIQALRDHQVDTNHLFSCPVCNQGFFTHEGQIQHQKAKHDQYEDTQSSTSDSLSTFIVKDGPNERVPTSVVMRDLFELVRDIFT